MQVFHPKSQEHFAARDALLQSSLRPEHPQFPISDEYPIVLSAPSAKLSYCVEHGGKVVAHANLWPRERQSIHGARDRIGLIGNVATAEDMRGQGVMRTLFETLVSQGQKLGLQALVLWSDLHQFYQKLGFVACGHELRLHFHKSRLQKLDLQSGNFSLATENMLGKKLLKKLLTNRHPVPSTVTRSPEEFAKLLQIPATFCFLSQQEDATKNNQPYGILGKGYDMGGVVHEWGAQDPRALLGMVLDIMNESGLDEILLLAPKTTASSWQEPLKAAASSVELHNMALARPLNAAGAHGLNELFIWGLDGI